MTSERIELINRQLGKINRLGKVGSYLEYSGLVAFVAASIDIGIDHGRHPLHFAILAGVLAAGISYGYLGYRLDRHRDLLSRQIKNLG